GDVVKPVFERRGQRGGIGGRQKALRGRDDAREGVVAGIVEIADTRGVERRERGVPAGGVGGHQFDGGAGGVAEGVLFLFGRRRFVRQGEVDPSLDAFAADPPGVAAKGRRAGHAGGFGLDVHGGGDNVIDGYAGGIERGRDA